MQFIPRHQKSSNKIAFFAKRDLDLPKGDGVRPRWRKTAPHAGFSRLSGREKCPPVRYGHPVCAFGRWRSGSASAHYPTKHIGRRSPPGGVTRLPVDLMACSFSDARPAFRRQVAPLRDGLGPGFHPDRNRLCREIEEFAQPVTKKAHASLPLPKVQPRHPRIGRLRNPEARAMARLGTP